MKTYIALFRGINIGGANILPMKELTSILAGLGLRDIRTYIQSGNVLFRSDDDAASLAGDIGATVRERYGFEPKVMLLEKADMERAVRSNPFPEAESNPKTLHLAFLDSIPANPDLEGLQKLSANGEEFRLSGKLFYLHAPGGVGRSKLAAAMEKRLGVPITARNWRTVLKLRDMAEEY